MNLKLTSDLLAVTIVALTAVSGSGNGISGDSPLPKIGVLV